MSYGRTNTPCTRARSRLRLRDRTFTLQLTASCGRAVGKRLGHLYVGGLLAGR